MPYHDSTPELEKFLREKDFLTADRWSAMKEMGLDTMEDVAHAFGDITQAVDGTILRTVLKQIEGDWSVPRPAKDEQGRPRKVLKESAKSKKTDELTDADYDTVMLDTKEPTKYHHAMT